MVISVIGLLASIVIVSLNSARGKAKLAAGLKFAAQLDHDLEPLGVWRFEEGAGTIAADSSSYGRNGTIIGATWDTNTYDSDSSQYDLSFNGTSAYVDMLNPAQSNVATGTVSAWFNATVSEDNIIFNAFGDGLYPRIRITGNNLVTQWRMDGVTRSTAVSFPSYNVWHYLAASFDTTVGVRVYLDGVQVNSENTTGTVFNGGNTNMRVGYDSNLGLYMHGQIDDVRVYKSALTGSEIRKIYAEGLNRHKLAEKY